MAAAPELSAVDAFRHERFVDMFLSQSRRAQIGLFCAALLVAFMWYQATHSSGSLVWLAVATLVAGWRLRYTHAWVRRVEPVQRTRRIVTLLWINGLLMAVPLLAFPSLSELARSAVSIILLATATASVATTSGFRSVFVAFAAPMLVPLSLAWAWVGATEGVLAAWGMAALNAFFLLFLVNVGRQSSTVFLDACEFRLGQQQLNVELTQALEEASEANRAKTQFLAAASHDLRQPIHTMNILVAALSLRQLEGPAKEIVGLLGSVNRMLSQQLDTLLDMSKLDAGVVSVNAQVLDLGQLVQGYHASILPAAQERGLQLTLQTQPSVHVACDAALLTRALSNLVDNALKYTPRGGTVRLRVQRDGTDAVLQVADSGIGIAEHEQQRVFGEFYQVGNVERDRQKGLGLGLSIVRRLCTLLGLRLQLQSQLGAGTTVTLRLPTTQVSLPADAADQPSGSPHGLRVLVVDDEAMVLDSMRLLLMGLGCTVHLAQGMASAVSVARQNRLDIVLSDLRLRDHETGLEVIRQLQALQPALKAVLITGDTAPERIRDAQGAGVPLLFKPVTLNKLIELLPTVRA